MAMQLLWRLLSSFDLRIFPFSPYPAVSSQISLCRTQGNSVSKLFQEENVELCVTKSHIRKQSLRKLLSFYYMRSFPLSPWAPMGSQISLSRIHKKSVRHVLPGVEVIRLWDEITDQKEVSQRASFTIWMDDISFLSVGINAIQESNSRGSSNTVSMDCSMKRMCNSVRWIHTSPRSF